MWIFLSYSFVIGGMWLKVLNLVVLSPFRLVLVVCHKADVVFARLFLFVATLANMVEVDMLSWDVLTWHHESARRVPKLSWVILPICFKCWGGTMKVHDILEVAAGFISLHASTCFNCWRGPMKVRDILRSWHDIFYRENICRDTIHHEVHVHHTIHPEISVPCEEML